MSKLIIINSSTDQQDNFQSPGRFADLFQQLRSLSQEVPTQANRQNEGQCEQENELENDLTFLKMPLLKTTPANVLFAIQEFLLSNQTYQDYLNFRNAIWEICNEEYRKNRGMRNAIRNVNQNTK